MMINMRFILSALLNLFRQPPIDILECFRKVNAKYTYKYYLSDTKTLHAGNEHLVIVLDQRRPDGLPDNQQNCIGFALAYRKALGRGSIYNKATMKTGEMHAVLRVDGWELDCLALAPRWVGRT
jgi:hypothetical protein